MKHFTQDKTGAKARIGNALLSVSLALGLSGTASAAVIYRDIPDLIIPDSPTVVDGFLEYSYSEVDLDVDANGVADFKLYHSVENYWDGVANEYFDDHWGVLGLNGNRSGQGYPAPDAGVPYGAMIDAALPYYRSDFQVSGVSYGVGEFCCSMELYGWWDFTSTRTGYLGLQFQIDGAVHYGWLLASLDAPYGLVGYELAYESVPGVGIAAGVVPVPIPAMGPLAMLLATCMGALGIRRRRQKNDVVKRDQRRLIANIKKNCSLTPIFL